MKPAPWMVRALWIVVIVLAITGGSSAVLRALESTGGVDAEAGEKWAAEQAGDRGQAVGQAEREFLEGRFRTHRLLMLLHTLPGLLFMILGPLQFVPGLDRKSTRLNSS